MTADAGVPPGRLGDLVEAIQVGGGQAAIRSGVADTFVDRNLALHRQRMRSSRIILAG